MPARLGPQFSRRRTLTTRFAVAGVAALAAVVGTAPMAVADDDVDPADTGTTETVDPAPTDPAPTDETPTDEEPTDETSDPADQEPTDESTAPLTVEQAERSTSTAKVAAAIVPDFGYNKFRVGVRIADGSTVPAGVTTLGSTITIVETGPGVDDDPRDGVEGTKTTMCTTTIDEGPVGTFCDNLSNIGFDWPPALYVAEFGDVVTVTQTTVNAGLTIIDGVKIVVPTCDPEQSNCGEGTNTGNAILTDAPPPVDEPDPAPDPDETLMLPDTGGSNAELLALSLALIGGGGWLIGKGRQPRRRSDALV